MKKCEKYKEFNSIIQEVEIKIMNFVENYEKETRKKTLEEFYYYIGRIMARIKYEIEKDKFTNKIPRWLKQFYSYSPPMFMIPWLDHPKFTKNEELISEPYNVNMKDIEELINFCKEHGLDFVICGDSVHFPGHTFRIILNTSEDYPLHIVLTRYKKHHYLTTKDFEKIKLNKENIEKLRAKGIIFEFREGKFKFVIEPMNIEDFKRMLKEASP